MDYYLTIDRGNSHIKGALWDSDRNLISTRVCTPDVQASAVGLDLITPEFHAGDRLCGCAYSTVVSAKRDSDLNGLDAICSLVLNVDASTPLPFSVGYRTPATLGPDRIAAVAGALDIAPAGRSLVVVDAGTAVTYEFVTASREYAGGNIAPGLEMRVQSLHEHTAALPEVSLDGEVPLVGDTTAEAIRSGAVHGLLGEISYYLVHWGESPLAVLTGGGCAYLSEKSLITFDHILDAHLVLRGLNSILRYNETL